MQANTRKTRLCIGCDESSRPLDPAFRPVPGSASLSPAPVAANEHQYHYPQRRKPAKRTNLVKQIHRRLNRLWTSRNNHQPLPLLPRRHRLSIHRHARRTGLHNLNRALAHLPDLVDLAAALADDTPDQVVGDVDVLRLQRAGRRLRCGRGHRGWTAVWVVLSWSGSRAVSGDVGRAATVGGGG